MGELILELKPPVAKLGLANVPLSWRQEPDFDATSPAAGDISDLRPIYRSSVSEIDSLNSNELMRSRCIMGSL